MSAFDLSGLTASFGGERVLGPLALRVQPGEKVALVGTEVVMVNLVAPMVEKAARVEAID